MPSFRVFEPTLPAKDVQAEGLDYVDRRERRV